MATSRKTLRDNLRNKYLDRIIDLFTKSDEEVLRTGSNEIAFPCVDAEGNDEFIVVTVKVPTGERGGDPYDGYGEAEAYAMKVANKAEKAKEAAAKKAAKIAKDEADRKARAEAKARAKAEKEEE
jgi:hypothetical protein